MWITRSEEPRVARLARQRPVVVLTGARQSGKTSLVRRLFADHSFVSLDLPSEAAQAEHDPGAFLRRHPPPVVIDEVQYAPGLFRHLKTAVDEQRGANGRFVLTGSQSFTLMRGVSESLAGRAAIVELPGLTLDELRGAGLAPSTEEVIVRGTMPELWAVPELDPQEFYRSYVATYLERDLRSMLDVGSLRDYERFLRAAALRSGHILNKAELARDVGISPSTAAAWLSILEASNQVKLLEPWFANATKSLVKSPKLYLCDPGLLAYLQGLRSVEDLLDSPNAGPIWETFVFAELRARVRRNGRGDLFYWRDRSKEADFLVHRGGRFELYDAKWSEIPDSRGAELLARVARELPERSVRRMAIVCRTRNAYPMSAGVSAIPIEDV